MSVLEKRSESEKTVTLLRSRGSIFKTPAVFFEGSVFPDGASPHDELDTLVRLSFDLMMLPLLQNAEVLRFELLRELSDDTVRCIDFNDVSIFKNFSCNLCSDDAWFLLSLATIAACE